MEVHFSFSSLPFFSVLFFLWKKGGQGEGSGLCLAPFQDEGVVTMPPVSACSSGGDDADGYFHGFSGHCRWSSHTGCTLNLSFLTRGHRERTLFFLLPEMHCPVSVLRKLQKKTDLVWGICCRFCCLSSELPKFRKFENHSGGCREGATSQVTFWLVLFCPSHLLL